MRFEELFIDRDSVERALPARKLRGRRPSSLGTMLASRFRQPDGGIARIVAREA